MMARVAKTSVTTVLRGDIPPDRYLGNEPYDTVMVEQSMIIEFACGCPGCDKTHTQTITYYYPAKDVVDV